ncbi:MAG: hypothetical protein KA155_04190 [Alphaproteobacteria bacterium]|jgi:phosphoribosylanthranilate isomerase|nr:hypothetical protein [Alphaproteobacteria bacterium]
MKPYIGIAGVTTRQQTKAITGQFYSNAVGTGGNGHYGLMGYCLTSEMINGHDDRTDPRYIKLDDLYVLNFKQPFGRNAIHYSPHPEAPDDYFTGDLYSIFMGKGSEIYKSGAGRVLQINRAFNVSAASMSVAKEMLPSLTIIFQLGPDKIMEMRPDELVSRIAPYSPNIHAILLDSSYGTGSKMDTKKLVPYVAALEKVFPSKILVFAGGLNPENVAEQISALSQVTTRPFSIDVESGVRNERGELDLYKTEAFIQRAAREFERLYHSPIVSVPDSTLG